MHQITGYGSLKGNVPFQGAILQSPAGLFNASNNDQERTYQETFAHATTVSGRSITILEEFGTLNESDAVLGIM